MLNLPQLVKLSEPLRKVNSKFVKVVGYKTGMDKKGIPTAVAKTYTDLEYNVHHKVVRTSSTRYISSVKFLDRKHKWVQVSCSCPDYLYRWEYANHMHGASEIIFGNGEPAGATNPENRPGLCKHLLALRKIIKDRHGV